MIWALGPFGKVLFGTLRYYLVKTWSFPPWGSNHIPQLKKKPVSKQSDISLITIVAKMVTTRGVEGLD